MMENTLTIHNTGTDGAVGQLSSNWLDSTTTTDTWIGDPVPTITTPYISPYVGYPVWYTNTVHICHCHWCSIEKKVRMSLKEVDTLRRAAKKDAKLRDVLQRLTDFIEVEVEL